MQAFQHFFQAVVQATAYRIATERQPLGQDFYQPLDLRAVVQTDHVHVDAVAAFQIGGRKQVVHHLFQIDTVGTWHDHQPRWVLVIGFITQIFNHRQLFGAHLAGNLLQHLGAGNLVRQGGNHRAAVFFLPNGAHTH
ncbi:hypothetical protein D3C79_558980 [compost metagenome]